MMELTQNDRNSIRDAQHRINSTSPIGNIIEHPVQDPAKYKRDSRAQEGLQTNNPELPRVKYESVYLKDDKSHDKGVVKPEDEQSSNLRSNVTEKDKLRDEDIFDDTAVKFLNMDTIEFDKLEWMSQKAQKAQLEKMKATTQFDCHGRAVAATELEDKLKKGEQTHDIPSLINLLDSAYDPQVTYALKVISKISNLATVGYYDGAFDENIHEILIRDCLLRVRTHIDSSNETVCISALNCMKSLLNNTLVDEVLLDRIFPLTSSQVDPNQWLRTIEMEAKPFDIGMKDQECVNIDVINALIQRTNILTRFKDLINTKGLEKHCVLHETILDIIMRMLRHSLNTCLHLIKSGLLKFLVEQFLPSAITTKSELIKTIAIKTLKISRIVAAAIREGRHNPHVAKRARDLRLPSILIERIKEYFFIDCLTLQPDQCNLYKIQIETVRLVTTLVEFGECRQTIVDLTILAQERLTSDFKKLRKLDPLRNVKTRISIDWQYIAHLINLAATIMRCEKKREVKSSFNYMWSSFITTMTLEWLNKILRMRIIPHLDCSIAVVTSMNNMPLCHEDGQTYLVELLTDGYDNPRTLNRNYGLDFFKHLAQTANARSQLPSVLELNGKLRDPKNLPSYGFLNFNTSEQYTFELNKVFQNDSPFILLSALINLLQPLTPSLVKRFVDSYELHRFIRASTHYHKLDRSYESIVQHSIPNQFEVIMISNALLLITKYYLEPQLIESSFDTNGDPEPKQLKKTRAEAYSQFIFCTASVICLLSRAPFANDLKEQMLISILFENQVHYRTAREILAQVDTKRLEQPRLMMDVDTVEIDLCPLSKRRLDVLLPVYLACEQQNRFWILQPIIEFYEEQIKNSQAEHNKKLRGRWFRTNITPANRHTTDFNDCSDADIISVILLFNYQLMKTSPTYRKLIVQPNVEDYLCVLGIVFLDDDIFLDEELSKNLQTNLDIILSDCVDPDQNDLSLFSDASKLIKPLQLPLSDFFNKLVDQFEGVSFGDENFANFLLLFMTQRSDKIFRKKLFQERFETCLSQLKVCIESVWLPRQLFFSKMETDPELRALMRVAESYIPIGTFLCQYVAFHTHQPRPK